MTRNAVQLLPFTVGIDIISLELFPLMSWKKYPSKVNKRKKNETIKIGFLDCFVYLA